MYLCYSILFYKSKFKAPNETKEVIRIINSGSRRRKKMIYIVVWYIYIYIYYLAHQQKYNQSYQIIKLKQDIVILRCY